MWTISKNIIWCLFFVFLFEGAVKAADTPRNNSQAAMEFQNITNELKRAIQSRDFGSLKSDMPEKKTLSWSSCSPGLGVNLTVDEVINKLSAMSKNATTSVNEMPIQPLYVTIVETKGWQGKNPYLYFEFKVSGDSWRWLGVYDCNTRDSDFRSAQGEDVSANKQLPEISGKKSMAQQSVQIQNLINTLKMASQAKDFKILKEYVPIQKLYSWGPCGPGDSGYDELTFEAVTAMLLKDSHGVKIYFNPKPEIDQLEANIDTEGWASEYPFLIFNYDFLKDKRQWVWSGVCYSSGPPLKLTKDGKKYEKVYFREPKLPRPGPRIFKDYSALKDRIEEIIHFKAFDAFKPYAMKGTLIFGECSEKMMKKDMPIGQIRSVDKIIDFLQKSAVNAKEIKFSGEMHKMYYETVGWGGEYTVIAFWINEGKAGWELTGVSYCKSRHAALLFPNEPRFKK